MSMTDQVLIETLKSLLPQQRAEVEDFVEFLAAKTKKTRRVRPTPRYRTGSRSGGSCTYERRGSRR